MELVSGQVMLLSEKCFDLENTKDSSFTPGAWSKSGKREQGGPGSSSPSIEVQRNVSKAGVLTWASNAGREDG